MKTLNRTESAAVSEGRGAAGRVACSVLREGANGARISKNPPANERSAARPGPQQQRLLLNDSDYPRPAGASQPAAARDVPRSGSHVENTEGFWMLSFGGRVAVLPQHQGLFYVAYLLANPDVEPIAGMDLAGEVFEKFGEHEDFRPPIPMGYRDDARVAKILLRKEKRLERIVDRDEEDIVVRVEALRELMVLDELKRIYFSQVAREAKNAGEVVAETLRELHATLACAVDARGNPNRVVRDFGMHLLHYVLMPSKRVSAREGVEMFVYRPAVEGN